MMNGISVRKLFVSFRVDISKRVTPNVMCIHIKFQHEIDEILSLTQSGPRERRLFPAAKFRAQCLALYRNRLIRTTVERNSHATQRNEGRNYRTTRLTEK